MGSIRLVAQKEPVGAPQLLQQGYAQVDCVVVITLYIYSMTVEEYLNTAKDINLSELARKMWPNNVNADSYLYRKLSGARPFTQKDRNKALLILKALSVTLSELE